jgi:hypothetical protein
MEAKNCPLMRRHGKPIIVERVTPDRTRNGSASSQKRTSPGDGDGSDGSGIAVGS